MKGSKYFSEGGLQNVLVFQPLSSYSTTCTASKIISSWLSEGMLEKIIKIPFISDNCFAPEMIYDYGEISIKFDEIFLRQDSICFIHGNVVSIYIVYQLDT